MSRAAPALAAIDFLLGEFSDTEREQFLAICRRDPEVAYDLSVTAALLGRCRALAAFPVEAPHRGDDEGCAGVRRRT